MPRDFCILIDVGDRSLADYAVKTALSLETSGRLVVIEAKPFVRALGNGHPFAIAVFDESHSLEEISLISSSSPRSGLPFVAIRVVGEGEDDPEDSFSKIISVSRALFEDCFVQLIAFCYITHLVRGALVDARKLF